MKFRIERDSMGEVKVPQDRYYGAQTQRAVENFPIGDRLFPRSFIKALGLIKREAARTNLELGLLDKKVADSIIQAADEVAQGNFDQEFVLSIFQTGSGTSTNMNANEVIANRAKELLGGEIGGKGLVHPNDHVNKGQSSNDVIPTAIHLAALAEIAEKLIPAWQELAELLEEKAEEFWPILKIGRTHLQDATPIRLGQEFSGYASQIKDGVRRLEQACTELEVLALGGTAVGTGINAHPRFAEGVIEKISAAIGLPLRKTENHFAAQAALDALVAASGTLKTLAVSLYKVSNDIRWMSSGPRCGIGEIRIPELQPGSSIMPGKINPVIPEAVGMVCAQVIGNDLAVSLGGQSGNFELNIMMPLIASNLLESIGLLADGAAVFSERCVRGLEANEERCLSLVEKSLALSTSLVPSLGYDRAAELAFQAHAEGKTLRQVLQETDEFSAEEIDEVLDVEKMT